jgi:cytidine deaminase
LINQSIVFYAFGYNQYNIGINFLSIHAEHHAVNKLRYSNKRKKVDVIIFRICNNGEDILCAAPCENCQRILINGIKNKGYILNRVYYTNKLNETFSCIKKN